MASASSSASFFSIAESDHHQIQPQPQSSTTLSSSATTASGSQQPSTAAAPPQKKKRNQPGNPNPDAEVIALSPKTLMATNRFVCEVCNKGFQREQNLQLHRRGHNLPWKLKQKSTKEVRRKVYLCPEPTCVHHEPSRALGDLTGIKKHFCRKHGEKKWKCEKCSKRYAVQSDWKAHSKTCGTREYRCDCGTLFSRRDSFITHRAFCDALAQESARLPTNLNTIGLFSNTNNINLGLSQVNPGHLDQGPAASSAADLLRLGAAAASAPQFDHFLPQRSPASSAFYLSSTTPGHDFQEENPKPFHGFMHNAAGSSSASVSAAASLFNLGFCGTTSNNANDVVSNPNHSGFLMADQANAEPMTLFAGTYMGDYTEPMQLPQMSATALLQKAAQMGSTTSGGSGAAGFGGITRAQMENEANLQDLMNSLANGNAGIFDGFGHHQGLNEIDHHHPHESKLHQSLMGGGSDGLTRDFLGVGSVVRGLGGGLGQRDQNQMGSLNSGSTGGSRSFGGGGLQ